MTPLGPTEHTIPAARKIANSVVIAETARSTTPQEKPVIMDGSSMEPPATHAHGIVLPSSATTLAVMVLSNLERLAITENPTAKTEILVPPIVNG